VPSRISLPSLRFYHHTHKKNRAGLPIANRHQEGPVGTSPSDFLKLFIHCSQRESGVPLLGLLLAAGCESSLSADRLAAQLAVINSAIATVEQVVFLFFIVSLCDGFPSAGRDRDAGTDVPFLAEAVQMGLDGGDYRFTRARLRTRNISCSRRKFASITSVL
jgi:hypothetical protein